MVDEFHFEISIPADNEGYVLLKCPKCGIYFKLTPNDIEDEGVLEIFCPSCGLVSENYITEDVLELALAMSKNKGMDILYDELKKIEREFSRGLVTFKAGNRARREFEPIIHSGIEALEKATFLCCKRTAKLKPMLILTGSYCPFCGVKNYEVK